MHRPIIFDFDGVIVDSEPLSNRALAECLTEHGFPTTIEESIAHYAGMRMVDCIVAVERRHGRELPPGFVDTYRASSFELLRKHLRPVSGAVAFVRACERERIAIASSSAPPRIALSLQLVGLADCFDGRVFSTAEIERGKPHPDVFLKAAESLRANPRDCVVIEDGTLGVEGARAAGMTVIGLTAGSHCTPAHADRLLQAGAHVVADTYREVAVLMRRFPA